uniref:Splicing factor YJU2 n=1 Tax=Daphnia pulex TaxID=6669 RepID=A0A4Y7MWX3_DAPPU|nr:EOG090X0G3U [Daphnia pulex]SVE85199.1 EOG090X0G3U [Daphnia pulex]
MSERKVLNKYYPPDFDPSKIPRVRQAKNRQFTVRLMAPFNMKCKTCGEYIYKGKKFNARKEDVENENYLGIRIYRFYIKCTRCLSEISFKTDPQSTDYVVEAGATRNFMALKLAEEQAVREMEAEKEEERTNPMKLLENRTKASRGEIEMVETLEELKELNKRKVVVNFDDMLHRYDEEREWHNQQEIESSIYISSFYILDRSFSSCAHRETAVQEEVGHSSETSARPKDLESVPGSVVGHQNASDKTAKSSPCPPSMRKTNMKDSMNPQQVPRRSIMNMKTSTSINRTSLLTPATKFPLSIQQHVAMSSRALWIAGFHLHDLPKVIEALGGTDFARQRAVDNEIIKNILEMRGETGGGLVRVSKTS